MAILMLPTAVICPACLKPIESGTVEGYDGPICLPSNCSAWKTIGKSKNGGPILSIVQDD